MSAGSLLATGLARAHRFMPRLAGYVHTNMFVDTRRLGRFPDDMCPLGATRIALDGVPRVAAAYVWGSGDPTVLALHGWGADSTTMSAVVAAALDSGESAVCFDAPGHGVSPGSRATMKEYADATLAVLQRFPSIHTIVAHSMSSIAAVSAVAESGVANVRSLLLLAPTCSLAGVIDRWAAQQGLPPALVTQIHRELQRRDGMPVPHWDVRTVGLPPSVGVRILHDPTDEVVPLLDSHLIAADIPAEVHEIAAGAGHHRILGSEEMQRALSACLDSNPRRCGGTATARHG
ncbi:alpha/beta hydrolase [Mycobacterium sp.]|uniref:alpha/beta fold hydrolase n=1 Tax=Mycobacterium sp. TaxID=1785 RepID=UPI002C431B8C|nr:alpha/beta hydrolase [Mycobacterium sp.]HTQ16325.1 alpha/beta hydrolase [Mycobacterium sp.]